MVVDELQDLSAQTFVRRIHRRDDRCVIVPLQAKEWARSSVQLGKSVVEFGAMDIEERILKFRDGDHCGWTTLVNEIHLRGLLEY